MLPGSDHNRNMHLRCEVVACNGIPPSTRLVCELAQCDGRLGRDPDKNDLVLEDEKRVISSSHADIRYRDGEYFLIDKSKNGTYAKSGKETLKTGHEYLLSHGEQILIGGYLIEISLISANAAMDGRAKTPPGERLIELDNVGYGPPSNDDDAVGSLKARDGWDGDAREPDWWRPVRESIPVKQDEHKRLARVVDHHIPPLGGSVPKTPEGEHEQAPEPPKKDERIPTGYVPFPNDVSGIHKPPIVDEIDIDVTREDPNPGKPGGISSEISENRVAPDNQDRELNEPVPDPYPPGGRRAEQPAGEDEKPPLPVHPEVSQSVGTPVDGHLLEAFLRGLKLSDMQVPPAKAGAFMEESGRLVSEAVQGLIDILRYRADFKYEFYIPTHTVMNKAENNLFKHSANSKEVISNLLAEDNSGYLNAADSTSRAFEDIAAHQLAITAGMEAIVEVFLNRLSPKAVEELAGNESMFEGVLPQVRKARMWDVFEKEYQQVKSQAADNLPRLLGQDFARAYVEQVERLKRAGLGGRPPE